MCKIKRVHRGTQREGREDGQGAGVKFPAASFPLLFHSGLHLYFCLSDTLQRALGSDWQQCGKWMNELLIWWLWHWVDWRNPNMSGHKPPPPTRSPAGSFNAHLLFFSFFTLYKVADLQISPQLREERLFSLRGSSNGPLPVCVIERAVPLPVWGK